MPQRQTLRYENNAGKYSAESHPLDKDDPHWDWTLGEFYISGYTRATDLDGNPLFLKNVGDEVTLWFALEQDIDWNYVDDVSKLTNAQRVENGWTPLDPTGKPYELHHIGQKSDSPLDILTNRQHHGNNRILHTNTGQAVSEVNHGYAWQKQSDLFLEAFCNTRQAAAS